MTSITKAIEKVEKLIATTQRQGNQAQTPVERIDWADIRSDLESALEKMQALRCYQEASDTNYDALWEQRKAEIREFEEARNAWVRTQIFTGLLKGEL